MNLNQTAKQLQALFQETNKCVKGNWIAPETDEIVTILRDNLSADAMDRVINKATNRFIHKIETSESAQPKPEPWQEIAREAAKAVWQFFLNERQQPNDLERVSAIILAAIERSHAAQPKSDDHQRLKLAREAVVDWRAQKLSDCAAMFAVSLAIMPQPKPTEADVARAKSIIAAQPQRSEQRIATSSQMDKGQREKENREWLARRSDQPLCELCGHPMPKGEKMFKYHGHSGPCPKPPISSDQPPASAKTTDDKQETANVHIEHFFPKGYNPADEPWCSIKRHHNAAIAAMKDECADVMDKHERQLADALAAERGRILNEYFCCKHANDTRCNEGGCPVCELVAEREETTKARKEWEREAQRADDAEAAVGENCKTIARLERELTAERQRREQAEQAVIDAMSLSNEMEAKSHQQLLSALAAIDHHCIEWSDGDGKIDVDLSALREHDAEVRKPYDELLYAVERKWPNETRHQTALRYIRQAEQLSPKEDGGLPCGKYGSGSV